MVSSLVVFDYFFKMKAGLHSLCRYLCFLYYRSFLDFVHPRALDCLVPIGDFGVEGILNVLPGLSLFTFGVHQYFRSFPNGSLRFCLSCSGLIEDKVFSLFLMLFSGGNGDLCNCCFYGDFSLLAVVRVGVIDRTCIFVWTTTLDLSTFPCCWAGA